MFNFTDPCAQGYPAPIVDGRPTQITNTQLQQYIIDCVLPRLNQIMARPNANYDSQFNSINNNVDQTEKNIGIAITNGVNQVQGAVGSQTIILENIIRTQADSTRNAVNNISLGIGSQFTNQTNFLNNRLGATEQQIRTQVVNSQNILQNSINLSSSSIVNSVGNIVSSTANALGIQIGGIGEQVTDSVFDAVDGIFEPIYQWLLGLKEDIQRLIDFIGSVKGSIVSEGNSYLEYLESILHKVKNGEYASYDEFEYDLKARGVDMGLMKFVLTLLQLLPLLFTISRLTVMPFTEHLTQLAQTESLATLLTPDISVRANYKGFMTEDRFREELYKQGIGFERQQILLNTALQDLPPEVLRIAYLRGLMDETTLDREFDKQGYTGTNRTILKELFYQIPPVNDLIRFAVREVFTPDIAARFGLFQDYPTDFSVWAQQQGLSDQWAKSYWGAHWELPSLTMGYQMFHRRIISAEDLQLLLRAQDVMPFWRDKLTQLSYSPLTRVDVRRMHDMGVLGDEGVYNAYLDIGYSPENARNLLNFTKLYNENNDAANGEELKQLTRATIEKAFKRGLIDRQEAINRLQQLGYSNADSILLLDISEVTTTLDSLPDIAESLLKRSVGLAIKEYIGASLSREDAQEVLLDAGYSEVESNASLDLADLEHDLQLRIEIIDHLKKMFVENMIDETTLREMLLEYDFTIQEIDKLVGDYTILSNMRSKKLTKAEYLQAHFAGILDADELTRKLQGLGYFDGDIEILLRLKGIIEEDE